MLKNRCIQVLILCGLIFQTVALSAQDTLTCSGNTNHDGKKQGVWVCRKGEHLMRKERYKNGTLSSYILFNEKGQIIETRNKRGKVRKYNPCGC